MVSAHAPRPAQPLRSPAGTPQQARRPDRQEDRRRRRNPVVPTIEARFHLTWHGSATYGGETRRTSKIHWQKGRSTVTGHSQPSAIYGGRPSKPESGNGLV